MIDIKRLAQRFKTIGSRKKTISKLSLNIIYIYIIYIILIKKNRTTSEKRGFQKMTFDILY